MEDRRTAVAILLCIIVVMMYSEIFLAPYTRPPMPVPPKVEGTGTSAPAQTAEQVAPLQQQAQQTGQQQAGQQAVAQGAAGSVPQGHPSPAELAEHPIVWIDNARMVVELNLLGGRISSLTLKHHKLRRDEDTPYEMVSKSEGGVLPLAVYTGGMSDDRVVYRIAGVTSGVKEINGRYMLRNGEELSLKLEGILPNGTPIEKILKFNGDSNLFGVDVKLAQGSSDGSRLWLEWSKFEADPTLSSNFDVHGFTYLGESLNTIPLASVPDDMTELGENRWVAYGDKYFMAALVPATKGPNTRVTHEGNTLLARAAGGTTEGSFAVYVGPKDYHELQKVGHELHRAIDLGVFTFLARPLLELLRLFYSIFHNWGLAIVLLTLLIKALFLPLTAKSFSSMSAMQKLQPEVKALRERFKNDPTQMNQELMGLYKKHGVNPLGGCFPILIQIPVFLGLYNALLYSIELRHAPFALWINDLSAPERLELFGVGIPVMVILMGASMLVQQWTTPSAMDPTQKKIMMFMPLVFTFLFLNFPAGLVLYWLVNNVISIIQQMYIRSERVGHATRATALASLALFGFAFVLTLI